MSDEFYLNKADQIKRAVKNILLGVLESKHLVYGEYEVLEFFKKEIKDEDTIRVLSNTIANYSMLNYDMIKRRVHIVPTSGTQVVETQDGYDCLLLSIDYFQDSRIIQPVIILGENTNDIDFYEIIAKYYCDEEGFNIKLSYESDNGGGSSICDRFKRFQKVDNKFCLAFVDTDKRYPTCKEGETVSALKRAKNRTKCLCDYFIIDVHEIENLVPFNYVDKLTQISAKNRKKINYLRDRKPEFLRYYDLKKGIKKKSLIEDADYNNYAKSICECDPEIISYDVHYESVSDDGNIYPELCGVLRLTLKELKKMTFPPVLFPFQEEEWRRIGCEFLAWTCARNEESLN